MKEGPHTLHWTRERNHKNTPNPKNMPYIIMRCIWQFNTLSGSIVAAIAMKLIGNVIRKY